MKVRITLVLLTIALIAGCDRTYVPKPRGFFRIDLPEKEYQLFDTTYPYSFEYPVYAKIEPDHRPGSEPYWINIDFPQFNGKIHVSYKVIDHNLDQYLEDTRTFVVKLIPKADAINDSLVYVPERKVYGLIYNIEGSNAASPCQFFVTDSTSNFLRGALYFDFSPNNDSLSPVINFIRKDIYHMISTFSWK